MMTLDYHSPRHPDTPLYPADLLPAITPLRLIFWGALLCILRFSITEGNFSCDILNDTVGTILILVGVARLRHFELRSPYGPRMTFVYVVTILALIESVDSYFLYQDHAFLSVIRAFFSIAKLVADVLFCLCMMHLCLQGGLDRVARSWWVTTVLFLAIYLVPLGLFQVVSLFAIVMGQKMKFDLGPPALLLIPAFLVPLIHGFVSISRMKRAILAHALAASDQSAES